MTTVINFNFLNFFKLKLENRTVNISNDVRSYNQYFDNRKLNYSPEREEIIDVTPYTDIIEFDNRTESMMIDTYRTPNPVNTCVTHIIYNRRGETIQFFQEKGSIFNSYA